MRLDKYLAHAGLGTRRDAHVILRAGRIHVNGKIERAGDFSLGPTDKVDCDGAPVRVRGPMVVAFHKPAGLITATKDVRATVYAALPYAPEKMKPIGRLDKETEGLLLLTDDGELNHRLTSPRRHVEKEYLATLDRDLDEKDLDLLRRPLALDRGEKVRPAIVAEKAKARELRLVIDEGKYHQVRRMCSAMGYHVVALRRTRIGPIELGTLARGAHRELTDEEIDALRKAVKLPQG